MPSPNQIDRKREDVQVTAEDLVAVPEGPITEQGVRTNLRVGLLVCGGLAPGLRRRRH